MIDNLRQHIFAALAGTLVIIWAIGLATPARADMEQNGVSADTLLKDVVNYLTKLVAETNLGSRLELAKEASARFKHYKVEMLFPGPAILGATGHGLRMDDVTATVAKDDKNVFSFSIDLPYGAEILHADGKPKAEITWSKSDLRGIWHAGLEAPTVLHGALYDVRATSAGQSSESAVIRLDSLNIDQDLREEISGLWYGAFSFVLKTLDFDPPDDEIQISFGEASIEAMVDDFDLHAWQTLSKYMDSLAATVELGERAPVYDVGEAMRIIENLALGAGDGSLAVRDLHFFRPGDQTFSLYDMALRINYDNNRRPGEYRFTVSWQDLNVADLDFPREFFTHNGSLKLKLERFPARQILVTMMGQARDPGTATVFDGSQAIQLFTLPLIHTNRTVIHIEELILESPAASVRATGSLTAEAQSAMGAIGKAQLEVNGLDTLIETAAREALRNRSAQGALAFLAIAKGLGRPEIASNGRLVYVFDVILHADGMVTINNIPLQLIINRGNA